jgi:hypothetical protein
MRRCPVALEYGTFWIIFSCFSRFPIVESVSITFSVNSKTDFHQKLATLSINNQ